ncbi:hypothetical protein BC941DRAFT_499407 [Chlamydoabsidia padenii]|nr:hypothetical protein BC941DRAFT_499407 [Chlamydoabsidia padenii]
MDTNSRTSKAFSLGQRNECACSNQPNQQPINSNTWRYVVDRITQDLFSSTGVGLPSPHDYLIEYDGDKTCCDYCRLHGASFDFNSDPFSSQDAFGYRRERSEHILFRLVHCLGLSLVNVLRLDHGVFVVQKQQQQYNNLDHILNSSSFGVTGQQDIFTFDYNDMAGLISNNYLRPSTTTCSYTIGARYINAGNKQGDMMIRGAIPFWCQTLLLHEFYQARPPIKPGDTRYGLIPFASRLPLTFRAISDNTEDPDLLLWYERYAMDTSDHEFYGKFVDHISPEWQMTRLDILGKVVLCDLSHEDAHVITTLATTWAAQQGIIVE